MYAITARENRRRNSARMLDFIDPKRTNLRRYRTLILVVEHALAIGAIANTISVSLDLGWRSVCSWNCDISYFPLTWVLIPGVIHGIAWLSFVLIPKRVEEITAPAAVTHVHDGSSKRTTPTRIIRAEYPGAISLIVSSCAVGFAVGHVMFGTLVFSSLMFLMISDAVPVIIRYAASAVTCRIINQFELALMSEEYAVERVVSLSDPGPEHALSTGHVNMEGNK